MKHPEHRQWAIQEAHDLEGCLLILAILSQNLDFLRQIKPFVKSLVSAAIETNKNVSEMLHYSCVIMFNSQSGNTATEDCGLRKCCLNTMTRPHNLLHNLALGVSAAGMAFSNQEKPVIHTHTHTHTQSCTHTPDTCSLAASTSKTDWF